MGARCGFAGFFAPLVCQSAWSGDPPSSTPVFLRYTGSMFLKCGARKKDGKEHRSWSERREPVCRTQRRAATRTAGVPATEGREWLLVRRTEPDRDVALLLARLNLALPPQPPPRIRPPQVISIRAEGVAAFAARPVQNPATSTAPFASLAPVAEVGLEGNNSWSTCRVVYKTGMFCS